MSRVAIVGAAGMLGRTFRELLTERGVAFDAFDRSSLDVTSRESIEAGIGRDHRVILNCTAYTDVDGAETNEAAAMRVNRDAVAALASRAKAVDALLVHVSTDYVFDGRASSPYRVDEPRAPLNAYGRSKAAGEEALEASGARYLNARTSWLYAPWAKNFVRTIASASKTRPSLRVVDDQRGRPTSTLTLAANLLDLVDRADQGALGTFHVTDGGECSWFELARAVAAQVSPSCVVEPCSSAEFPRPAPRPSYSVLDLSRTEAVLGRPMTPWQDALGVVLARNE